MNSSGVVIGEVEALLDADLTRVCSDELLELWRSTERLRNRLAAMDQRFIVEAEARGLPGEFGARNIAALVRGVLRVEPRDAAARVRAADAAVGRVGLSGERMAAPFAEVGAAQAAGDISPRHAAVIVRAVQGLPDELQVSHGAIVEHDLVVAARTFDPHELGRLALRTTTLLDQDGALADMECRHRRRHLSISQRPDGSATITGEATAELAERLLTCLDALAAPKPAVDGTADPRTAGMRRHDGSSMPSTSSPAPPCSPTRAASPPPCCSPRPSRSGPAAPAPRRPGTARSCPRSKRSASPAARPAS